MGENMLTVTHIWTTGWIKYISYPGPSTWHAHDIPIMYPKKHLDTSKVLLGGVIRLVILWLLFHKAQAEYPGSHTDTVHHSTSRQLWNMAHLYKTKTVPRSTWWFSIASWNRQSVFPNLLVIIAHIRVVSGWPPSPGIAPPSRRPSLRP
jgi:hypothetical protein